MMKKWGAVVLAATILAGAGVASAVDANTVKACYDRGGALRLQLGDECPKGWAPLEWSVTGPQGPAGPQGEPGTTGPAGPPGLSGYEVVTAEGFVTPGRGQGDAFCPEGKVPLGGGLGPETGSGWWVEDSGPTANGWHVTIQGSPSGEGTTRLVVYVICAAVSP